jgi:hypothetical protein
MSEQIDKVTKTDDIVVLPGIMSVGQTKSGKPFYLGEEEAGPESDAITDKDGKHRYGTVAVAIAGHYKKGDIKMRTAFKIQKMTVNQWVEINFKASPLPFYASFGLMAPPPLERRCAKCGREHKEGDCVYDHKGSADGAEAYKGCNYLFLFYRVAPQRVSAEQGKSLAKVGPTLKDSVYNQPPLPDIL